MNSTGEISSSDPGGGVVSGGTNMDVWMSFDSRSLENPARKNGAGIVCTCAVSIVDSEPTDGKGIASNRQNSSSGNDATAAFEWCLWEWCGTPVAGPRISNEEYPPANGRSAGVVSNEENEEFNPCGVSWCDE